MAEDSPACCHLGTQVPSALLFHHPPTPTPDGGFCVPGPSCMEGTLVFWGLGRIKSIDEAHSFLQDPADHWPTSLLLSFHYQELSHIAILTARLGWEIDTYE